MHFQHAVLQLRTENQQQQQQQQQQRQRQRRRALPAERILNKRAHQIPRLDRKRGEKKHLSAIPDMHRPIKMYATVVKGKRRCLYISIICINKNTVYTHTHSSPISFGLWSIHKIMHISRGAILIYPELWLHVVVLLSPSLLNEASGFAFMLGLFLLHLLCVDSCCLKPTA